MAETRFATRLRRKRIQVYVGLLLRRPTTAQELPANFITSPVIDASSNQVFDWLFARAHCVSTVG
jgi:hypothetical protein